MRALTPLIALVAERRWTFLGSIDLDWDWQLAIPPFGCFLDSKSGELSVSWWRLIWSVIHRLSANKHSRGQSGLEFVQRKP